MAVRRACLAPTKAGTGKVTRGGSGEWQGPRPRGQSGRTGEASERTWRLANTHSGCPFGLSSRERSANGDQRLNSPRSVQPQGNSVPKEPRAAARTETGFRWVENAGLVQAVLSPLC